MYIDYAGNMLKVDLFQKHRVISSHALILGQAELAYTRHSGKDKVEGYAVPMKSEAPVVTELSAMNPYVFVPSTELSDKVLSNVSNVVPMKLAHRFEQENLLYKINGYFI